MQRGRGQNPGCSVGVVGFQRVWGREPLTHGRGRRDKGKDSMFWGGGKVDGSEGEKWGDFPFHRSAWVSFYLNSLFS